MGRVIVVGSVNEDVVAVVERRPGPGETLLAVSGHRTPGGKGANKAVAASRAGAGVTLVGAVGDDAAGEALVAALAEQGVGTDGVARLPGQATGTALITLTGDGENTIVVISGANMQVSTAAVTDALADLRPDDIVLLQLEIPVPAVTAAVAAAVGRGTRAVLNAAPVRQLAPAVLAGLDPLVVNEHEAAGLLGGSPPVTLDELGLAAQGLVALGARSALVTGGGRGAALAGPEGVVTLPATAPGPVVDTTGAGDALCGALAAGLAGGATTAAALADAVAFAGESVTRPGAWTSYPDRRA